MKFILYKYLFSKKKHFVIKINFFSVHEGKDNSKGYCDKCGRVVR